MAFTQYIYISDHSFPKHLINRKKIILKEQDQIISERKVTEIFMDYFNNVTKTIDVPKYDPLLKHM